MKKDEDTGTLGANVQLDQLKRPQLQKLAKLHGVKANLRNARLIEQITKKLQESISKVHSTPNREIITKKSLSPDLSDISPECLTLDSISPPPLEDLSINKLDIVEADTSVHTIQSRTTSRSSSRSRSGRKTDDSDKQKKTSLPKETNGKSKTRASQEAVTTRPTRSSRTEEKIADLSSKKSKKTPTNVRKNINTHTFSVPKNRTTTRLGSSEKQKSKTTKPAIKRKSTFTDNRSPQLKRGKRNSRKSKEENKKSKEVREKVITIIENKVGHKSELRAFNKKFPSFAAEGVIVPKATVTPSSKIFEKVHEKNFQKMESIDDYQRRKEERIEKLFGSSKKQERISRLAKPKTPSIVKPVTRPKPSFMSPKPRSVRSTKKSTAKKAIFKPTVTKVSDINMNFPVKRSKLMTPKKVAVSFAKSPEKQQANPRTPAQSKKSFLPQRKSATPFRQNTSLINTPPSGKKGSFNLQESLKKPLSWKPHKGPLKQYDDTAKKPNLKERAKNLKQPKVTSRETRRAKVKEARAVSKTERMMKRRGIK